MEKDKNGMIFETEIRKTYYTGTGCASSDPAPHKIVKKRFPTIFRNMIIEK